MESIPEAAPDTPVAQGRFVPGPPLSASPKRQVNRLKAALQAHHEPGYMVAARVGISPSKLSQYSLREPIPPIILLRLAEVLNREPEDLLGFVEV